ncbi:MAG: YceH family protein [Acidimicrobiales bacterium]
MRLSQEEARVIGSLIEKQLTTPDQYPLSLNALLLACNQSSNRDPVVVFDDGTVDRALAALKVAGLVRLVYPSHGRSVTRYQQLLGEQLAISERQAALVAVLLLRGPQTAGELRSRTARMCEFDDIAEVEVELQGLGGLPEPVVARLPRRPGQKEERWAQLLTDASTGVLGEPASDVPHGGAAPTLASDVAELHIEVAELRDKVAKLCDDVEALQRALHQPPERAGM